MSSQKRFKINWGHALIIFFACYISFLVFVVLKSRTIDHSLVVENYFQQDLDYQQQYDKIQNRSLLEQDLKITVDKTLKIVHLDFGNANKILEITAKFYRASNSELDFTKQYSNIENNSFDISYGDIPSGKWTIKLAWSDQNKSYFKEQYIYL